jgi:hypothetical protein
LFAHAQLQKKNSVLRTILMYFARINEFPSAPLKVTRGTQELQYSSHRMERTNPNSFG